MRHSTDAEYGEWAECRGKAEFVTLKCRVCGRKYVARKGADDDGLCVGCWAIEQSRRSRLQLDSVEGG